MAKEEKKKSWFRRHWILTTLGVLLILLIISAFANNSSNPKQESSSGLKILDSSPSSISSNTSSSTYTAEEVAKMSLSKKLDLCTKDVAGDSIDIPQVKDEAYASCHQIYYSGGEEALNEVVVGIAK